MEFVDHNLPYAIKNFQKLLEKYRDLSFRAVEAINSIEKAILVIAATELFNTSTDSKVVINEAIEVAKSYGGEDSYIFVNSVVHQLALTRN